MLQPPFTTTGVFPGIGQIFSGLQTYIYMMLLHRLEMHILVMLEAFPLFLYWTLLCSFCFSNEKMLTEECEVNVTLGLRYLFASMSIEKGRHSRLFVFVSIIWSLCFWTEYWTKRLYPFLIWNFISSPIGWFMFSQLFILFSFYSFKYLSWTWTWPHLLIYAASMGG